MSGISFGGGDSPFVRFGLALETEDARLPGLEGLSGQPKRMTENEKRIAEKKRKSWIQLIKALWESCSLAYPLVCFMYESRS